MFYVLLALLVSMVLVFGVSCDNSNKTPGGAEGNLPVEEPGTGGEQGGEDPAPEPEPVYPIDLGTEFAIPDWTIGTYNTQIKISESQVEPIELKLNITDSGEFSIIIPMNEFVIIEVDNNSISNITNQIVDLIDGNKKYELTADFTLKMNGNYGEPTEGQTLTVAESGTGSLIVTFPMLLAIGYETLVFNPVK